MKQFLLDTNVILRYLTNDVPSQAEKVKNYLIKAKNGQISIEATKIVVIEVLFQLKNWYGLNKSEAADKVLTFFSPEWMELEDKSLIFEALRIYKSKNIDFVDIILYLEAGKLGKSILTFDRDFEKLDSKVSKTP